jgi:hypothetical protein
VSCRLLRPWTIALAVATPLAAAYLVVAPPAADLAAATYRSDLFARAGFTTWDTGWYAAHGHWLPSYSLLSPALGALLGVRLLLALSAVAAATLFGLVAERTFGLAAARVSAAVFALGFGVGLLSGRVPYDLGFAIGLGAVLALTRGRFALALGLAVLTSAASPVAGAFLALSGVAGGLAGVLNKTTHPPRARGADQKEDDNTGAAASRHGKGDDLHGRGDGGRGSGGGLDGKGDGLRGSADSGRSCGHGGKGRSDSGGGGSDGGGVALDQDARRYLALAVAALAPILVLSLAYPEGGYEPFAASAFWPALAGVVLVALLLPRGPLTSNGRRVVRAGAALYALALIGAYTIHTPLGGNAARLGALLAAPLLAGVLWERRRTTLLLLAPVLLYWQLATPIRDYSSIVGDPSVHASYYAPALAELRRLNHGKPTIVEVPLTKAHWEASYLAGHDGVSLARGWERQLDTRYAALFYRPTLTAPAYRAWLTENRVAYLALPDAPLDKAGSLEGRLIARGVPYLRELWHSKHWRLYRFMG